MADADEWERVTPAAGEDEWEQIPPQERFEPPSIANEMAGGVPDAFFDRVKAGASVSRIMKAAVAGAKEGAGTGTPTGFEDDTLAHLIELGVFHDPAKGRPGPLQTANEAIMMPAAQLWQAVTRATSGALHGAGGAVEQLVTEFGGSQGSAAMARRDVISLGEWAMIEGGMGHVSRPSVEAGNVLDRTVGTLPTEADFATAGKVLTTPKSGLTLREAPEGGVYEPNQINVAKGEKYFKVYDQSGNVKAEALVRIQGNTAKIEDILAPDKPREEGRGVLGASDLRSVLRQFQEQHPEIEKITGDRVSGASMGGGYDLLGERRQVEMNLRRMWREDGIHPAEAVHDAERDAFVKNEIVAPREEIQATSSPAFNNQRLLDTAVPLHEGNQVVFVNAEKVSNMLKPIDRAYVEPKRTNAKDFINSDPDQWNPPHLEARTGKYGDRVGIIDGIHRWAAMQDEGMTVVPVEMDAASIKKAKSLGLIENKPTALPKEWDVKPEEMEQAFGEGASLSAAVTPPEEIPVDIQPPSPPGSLVAAAQKAADTLFDIGRDIQMKLSPMATGSRDSMATVKDYANAMRRNAWDSARIDTDLTKRFTAEQRERMARAMEEESLSLRLGEPEHMREHQGLATLAPEERAAVEELDRAQQLAWLRARDAGIVEGDGIPMHFPRMAIGAKGDTEIGKPPSLTQMYGIRKNSPYTRQRAYLEADETEKALKAKYGDQAKIAWDIRAVNLATKMLEDAVAGRSLINNIEEAGRRTGDETVAVGFKPGDGWFTVDHPAFQKWRPKLGDDGVIKDATGNPVFESVPIYVRGDFEGPLRAAMWGSSGDLYRGMMALKGKTMGLIMNSPMIHNLVEFGRAFPAMPMRMYRVYFDGYRAKNDVATMHEAIDAGLVPIGKRFFNQDINAIMEAPDLTPGRSWTAKLAAAIPGLFDEAAGTAVKQAIDKAGDFWHNTLLWDRIADLQAGLYVNFRDDLIAKGMDRQTSARIAAHWANRYAGALPKEAMSEAATKLSNFLFFSRSFTFGNLGVMKDMLTGLPKDVLAQIERDAGFKAGSIEGADVDGAAQQAVTSARSVARRKAMMTLALDVGLMYVGNSVLQSAFNVLLGSNTLAEEEHSYLRRFREVLNEAQTHPLSLLQPFHIAERLSATGDNEPGKRDRVLIGYAKDGTGIYARNPVGKIGEEFTGYFSSPLDMIRKKEGTMMRPLMQILSNDAGFGRKIYDAQAETWSRYVWNVGEIVKHLIGSQLPVGQIGAAHDLVTGEGDSKVNWLQVAGPLAGVTFSRGAPGGPAVGEMYDAKSRREFAISKAMPDLRRQIQRGDLAGAQQAMGQLGMDPSYQRWVIKTSLNPRLRLSSRSIRDFYSSATDEQKARFERAQSRPAAP